jgi:ATP-dependent helicase/nuclease subunit A
MKTNIPIKPENATWTDDQWKAVMAKDQDILVAAAAGSGKTAVLVERMIRKMLAEEDPIDVDQLLVVTFTNASAAEMKHRIGEALEKAIDEQPDSSHLRKQLSLLNRASISTLHSFCLEVIRKYYYLTDIDPGFRIADATEAELLRDEVLDDLFESEYGKENNELFYQAVDTFTNDRSDIALQNLIRKLYDFSLSHPDPNRWLDKLVEMYDIPEDASIDTLPFANILLFDIKLQLKGAGDMLKEALELSKQPGGPSPRAENYLEDLSIVERLMNASQKSWEDLFAEMHAWKFSRVKTCKGDEYDPSLVKAADDLRKNAKGILEKVRDELFSRKPEYFIRDMREMRGVISTLIDLVKKFSVRFLAVKKEKGLVDFSDLEHYCLEILTEPGELGEDRSPSEAAKAYRKQFKEVLVDEYQDTNMVQETILKLVTKDSEYDGNLFMVGDVKQSIYRFRLAEPNLFLNKYQRFTADGDQSGLRIDLSQNFRSRLEVLEGTNFLFKQIMGVHVGEIDYDRQAELVKGAAFPENTSFPIELSVIDQSEILAVESDTDENEAIEGFDAAELEQSQLEARLLIRKIKYLIDESKPVYDPKTGTERPIQYRDIVVLVRSMTWAPEIMEEFKQAGIPLYANLSTGYFDATEVAIMLSLLKIIDNPYQDIPLAAVLRSPIIGLNEEQLARIRIHSKQGTFYEAVKQYIVQNPTQENEEIYDKLRGFMERFSKWRTIARQGALSELIWQLYRETRFYDFVGGLPGGKQRQANLRAFHDRARQYEETSFRGLFRFLRFIERMQERGDDLGAARALSEQEDVVRLMTIHSSKGLEFPVVFLIGLSRKFNMMDINHSFLLDKDYGLACKYTNPEKRITYPSLAQLAFKRKKKLETIAEEMRVLYVALTRAKEKLFLIGSVKNADKMLEKWRTALMPAEWLLKDYSRAQASSYLDWIGPALLRHHDCSFLQEPVAGISQEVAEHPSKWRTDILSKHVLQDVESQNVEEGRNWTEHVKTGRQIDAASPVKDEINARLLWKYSNIPATKTRSKQSVSELKRMYELRDDASGTDLSNKYQKPIFNRPKFMKDKSLSPAERGTAMHMVMQHLPFSEVPTAESIGLLLDSMQAKELLTEEQKECILIHQLENFFQTEIGRRLLSAGRVHRETPFNLAIPASEIYGDTSLGDHAILVQGIIDCIIEEEDGLILLDYKSDSIEERYKGGFEQAKPILEDRYKTQLDFYQKALERIWKKPVLEKYLYFFDGGHLLKL